MAVSENLIWETAAATVNVGESTTVPVRYGMAPTSEGITNALNGLAAAVVGDTTVTFTGVSAGVVTIPDGTSVGSYCSTEGSFTLTVVGAAEDKYLDEDGLEYYDSLIAAEIGGKQDALTAGTGISISNNVISATGGGVADAVEWSNVLNKPTFSTVATSGSYNDLSNKPTIGNATLTIQKNSSTVDTFTANATSNKTINITVPTTAADVSALPASTKYGASISVSVNTTDYKVTTTLKDQDGNTLGTAQVIDLPLESVVVNGSYDNTNKKIVLTLQNGNTVDIPVADLVAGLQSEITSTNKLASDLVDDTNQTNKFMTSAEKTKLSGIAAGAEVNVQSDWTQTTTTADDYIKNKPTLATVATSGSYNDLSDKPTIPGKQVFYGTCSTASSSGSKTVSCSGFTYANDNVVYVTFSNEDTYSGDASMTMNVNSTGAKRIVTQVASGSDMQSDRKWGAGETVCFVCYNDRYLMVEANVATTTIAGLMSPTDKTKLNGIAAGAEVNVQSDWNVTSTTSDAFIKNKPTIPTKTSDLTNDSGFLSSVAWGDVINKPTFSAVATSGSYNDLSNKPTIPAAQVNSDWDATSGVAQILNKPTKLSQFTNDSGFITSYTETDPIFSASPAAGITSADITSWNNKSTFSGNYNDLTNKPTIGNATLTIQKNGTNVDTFTANATSNKSINITVPTKVSDLTNDSGFLTSVAWGDVTGKPTFSTVATSGSYTDLSDKPTIPTVNNGTLTIQKNGTNVQTFTANQATNATANISVPTKTSDLTNDGSDGTSTYVEADELATVATTGAFSDMSGTIATTQIADGAITNAKIDPTSALWLLGVDGTTITENTNLNNLTTPGVYMSKSSAVTNTLANCPVSDSGFRLIVQYSYATTRYLQTLFGLYGEIYHRSYYSSGWGTWRSVANVVQNITSSVSPASSSVTIQSGSRVFKIGQSIDITMEISTSAQVATWGQLVTGLPIRNPASSIYFVLLDLNNANRIYRAYLSAAGNLCVGGTALPSGLYNINFSYITSQ